MEPIDIVVLAGAAILFVIWAADMFSRRGVFDGPGLPGAISAALTVVSGAYFLAGGNTWITGGCAFLALAYAITSIALKGSK